MINGVKATTSSTVGGTSHERASSNQRVRTSNHTFNQSQDRSHIANSPESGKFNQKAYNTQKFSYSN